MSGDIKSATYVEFENRDTVTSLSKRQDRVGLEGGSPEDRKTFSLGGVDSAGKKLETAALNDPNSPTGSKVDTMCSPATKRPVNRYSSFAGHMPTSFAGRLALSCMQAIAGPLKPFCFQLLLVGVWYGCVYGLAEWNNHSQITDVNVGNRTKAHAKLVTTVQQSCFGREYIPLVVLLVILPWATFACGWSQHKDSQGRATFSFSRLISYMLLGFFPFLLYCWLQSVLVSWYQLYNKLER